MTFDRPDPDSDLLAAGGYDEGDIVPVFTGVPNSAFEVTTSSSTYSSATDLFRQPVQWDQLAPAGAETVVQAVTTFIPQTGEEAFLRIQNGTDGGTLVEVSSPDGGAFATGWQTYTPATTGSPIALVGEVKTEPASNSSRVRTPTVQVGVRL